MSDTERVRAWRQRLKDGGLVPMTIWVNPETQARYQDLAARSHRSGSEIVQLALEAYRLDPAAVVASVTDIAQLRTLIHDELDQTTAVMAATVTATVTETITEMLPAIVAAAVRGLVTASVTDTETATPPDHTAGAMSRATVPDMATATDTDTAESVPPQGAPAALVSDTITDTETETTVPPRPRQATPPGQNKLTPRQAAALRAKRAAGAPIKALMDDYGISKASVFRYLKTPHTS
jgi:hypothetical protein